MSPPPERKQTHRKKDERTAATSFFFARHWARGLTKQKSKLDKTHLKLFFVLTRAQPLDEVTRTTKNWLGLQKQRISVVLHTAIAEQIVNELASGEGGRVHGAKCLAVLAGVA